MKIAFIQDGLSNKALKQCLFSANMKDGKGLFPVHQNGNKLDMNKKNIRKTF